MKLQCIIVDDEPIARQILEEFIEEIDFLELVGKATDPVKASTLLLEKKVDLVFLDINMPRLNGMDFLRSSKNLPNVIMTTAYPEYAVEGFSLDVLDYLVKPIAFERFLKSCEKAYQYHKLKTAGAPLSPEEEQYFFIKCNNAIEKIYYNDLLYVEGLLNYVVLHTVSGKKIVYITLKSLVEQLPERLFMKVQKSYVVNLTRVTSIEGNTITVNNKMITIGPAFKEEVIRRVVNNKMIKR